MKKWAWRLAVSATGAAVITVAAAAAALAKDTQWGG